jgi:hypothetical protein
MFEPEAPLKYPTLKHHTRWPGMPWSEEYVVPPEDKAAVLQQLYPFTPIPDLNATMLDIHEEKEFTVRDFKVVRENGMNMLVSPYYYRSGGSVIDWEMAEPAIEGEAPMRGLDDTHDGVFIVQSVRPGCEDRLGGLMELQHEGPAFSS